MKNTIAFAIRALPLTIGLILCLTALSFLVSFTDSASLEYIAKEDFITFATLALIGIPLLMHGIRKLTASPL